PELLGVREPVRHRLLLDLRLAEPGVREQPPDRLRVAPRGEPRLLLGLRREMTALDHHLRRHRHPPVLLARGPDREREPPARAEHAASLRERTRRLSPEHVPEP